MGVAESKEENPFDFCRTQKQNHHRQVQTIGKISSSATHRPGHTMQAQGTNSGGAVRTSPDYSGLSARHTLQVAANPPPTRPCNPAIRGRPDFAPPSPTATATEASGGRYVDSVRSFNDKTTSYDPKQEFATVSVAIFKPEVSVQNEGAPDSPMSPISSSSGTQSTFDLPWQRIHESATQLMSRGRIAIATTRFKHALAVQISQQGWRHEEVGYSWENLGMVYLVQEQRNEAKDAFEQARQCYASVFGHAGSKTCEMLARMKSCDDPTMSMSVA